MCCIMLASTSMGDEEKGRSKAGKSYVSVVIPTRNRPELVVRAVMSALAQDFGSVEVIVVVDGEDRETSEALRGICDARVRVIELAACVGGAEARNIGVRAAHGEWVGFLDDDDEWLPHKLSRQITAARRSHAAWPVVSSRMIVRTDKREVVRPLRRYEAKRPVSEYLFCRKSFGDGPYALQTSTLMMQKELMLTVPFRKGLKRHQDWDWVLRAERVAGVEFSVIEEPLAIYCEEDGRKRVGRSEDWMFSMAWGREMRGYFSGKAYSWFLATECMTRAVKSRAGLRVYAEILRRFVVEGEASPGSAAMMVAFLGLPQGMRERVHGFTKGMRGSEARVTVEMEFRNAGQ